MSKSGKVEELWAEFKSRARDWNWNRVQVWMFDMDAALHDYNNVMEGYKSAVMTMGYHADMRKSRDMDEVWRSLASSGLDVESLKLCDKEDLLACLAIHASWARGSTEVLMKHFDMDPEKAFRKEYSKRSIGASPYQNEITGAVYFYNWVIQPLLGKMRLKKGAKYCGRTEKEETKKEDET